MPIDLQDRTQYLELALFSQNVISALLDFVDKNKPDRLEASLKEALLSLEAVNSGDLTKLVAEHVAAFSSYEQLKTLEEVWSPAQQRAATGMIRDLLKSPMPIAKKRAIAEQLVELFSKLQSQALRHFNQPADAVAIL